MKLDSQVSRKTSPRERQWSEFLWKVSTCFNSKNTSLKSWRTVQREHCKRARAVAIASRSL